MTRRQPAIAALIAASLVLLAACAGSQAGPPLADAKAIITATLKATEAATSVHIDIAVDGKAAVALPIGGRSGPVDLSGTTISADVDAKNDALHATFAVPGILNTTGELIVVGGDAYLKTSITGAKYRTVDLAHVLPIDPTDPGALIDDLGDFLLAPGVDPTKGADVACGSGQCYTVDVDLDATELAAMVDGRASGLPVDLAGASLKMTLLVEKALPYHLAGLTASFTTGGNTMTIDLRCSKWDVPVTITAPPSDQVAAPG